jgi:hypothetical protein
MGRVAASDRLAKGFGLQRSGVAPAAVSTTRVTLTLKNGDKVEGVMTSEDPDWFRVDTGSGTVSVRKSEVTRVDVPKK